MTPIRSLRILTAALASAAILFVVPTTVVAQDRSHDGSVVFQVNADVTVPEGVHRDAVIVFGGNAQVLGEVNTAADVDAGSTVDQVRILDSVYHAAPGADVGSYETVEPAMIGAAIAPLAIAVWFGFALAYLFAGLVVAAIAGSQIRRAGAALTREPVTVAIASIGVLLGLPLLVALLAVTVVGIPAALSVAVVAIPLVWFVGSVAVAVRIGDWALLQLRGRVEASRPVGAAFVGLLVAGLVSIVPVLGFLVGLAGAGAVLLVAWRAAFGDRHATQTPAAQAGAIAA
jgi:hypothetical protein